MKLIETLCLVEWRKKNGRDGASGKMKQEIGKTPFPSAGGKDLQKCVSVTLTLNFEFNLFFELLIWKTLNSV